MNPVVRRSPPVPEAGSVPVPKNRDTIIPVMVLSRLFLKKNGHHAWPINPLGQDRSDAVRGHDQGVL
jgi:hypothetical protein